MPPPEQPSTNLPLVKLALMALLPSVEAKAKLPPRQVAGELLGQFRVRVPAGLATFEAMVTPPLADDVPPELVKLP